MRQNLIRITQKIFGIGMTILLTICLLAAIAYLAAFAVGQPASVRIHELVSGVVLPPVYYAGILLSFIGLLHLYLKGELLFRLDIPRREGGRKSDNNEA